MEMYPLIAAVATPAGTGAIGIVRMSGKDAIATASKIFTPYNTFQDLESLPGYRGVLGKIMDGNIELDEAVVYVYRGPRSYTGEDLVEICCHGSSFLVEEVLRLCLASGARPAEPGEFTKRAFYHGKLNLTQAEAVADLIAAQSEGARKAALAARDGALSICISEIREGLTLQSAQLAAWTDFPDEDLELLETDALLEALTTFIHKLQGLLETYDRGCLVRDGVNTAIVGKPNVGKSTLMNLLSGWETSIVTDIAGTTRDVVRERVRIGDWILNLADTAGIRKTGDKVESIGVDLAKRNLESAHLILAVFDSAQELDADDRELLLSLKNRQCIAIVNKMDLETKLDMDAIISSISHVVYLSARTGKGLGDLEDQINTILGLDRLDTTAAIVANERQRHCVQEAKKALMEARDALEAQVTLDAVNVCIDTALDSLLSLTGERTTDMVVDAVFDKFCVGK